jgi:chorismate--pyruvate lyase
LTEWLFDTGSLTQRLRRACPGEGFRVQVLDQSLTRPLPSERRSLEMGPQLYAWMREVRLLCDECAWVFARTLIPLSSRQGGCQRLLRLGARPLGEVLFNDPRSRRGRVEVARFRPEHALYRHALHEAARVRNDALWGRRSVFHLDDKPLLVCEIFLPDLPGFTGSSVRATT